MGRKRTRKPTETQGMIPGTDTRIQALETAGHALLDAGDKKAGALEKLRSSESKMLEAMKEHGVSQYAINGYRFNRKASDEKVEVKKIPVGRTANA